ncbi:MAG: hypothetical protein JST26_08090 [Bacteroidetes bacterium]|nr:hypothetical protein [Bacteroidota bacterium]
MKKLITLFILVFAMNGQAQNEPDRSMAEASVVKFMTAKHKNYEALTFGECFRQYPSEELRKTAHAKKMVVYSIIHTYAIGKKKTTKMYFHLDESYHVIGYNTDEEMGRLVQRQLEKSPVFDSITKSIEAQMKADTLFRDK